MPEPAWTCKTRVPFPARTRTPTAAWLVCALFTVGVAPAAAQVGPVRTVFVIVMSAQNWSSIKGSPDAPYINGTLLPSGASAGNYSAPPGLKTALPSHLWLEAGSSLGVVNDAPPYANHQSTTSHLSSALMQAGVSWKSYHEDIDGRSCPTVSQNLYSTSTNPFVFFDDITANSTMCLAHVRPYSELAGDLAGNTVARYNFIKPNLCHSMHQSCPSIANAVRQGDAWLAAEVPKILASAAYQTAGALFILWDHTRDGTDSPLGMILLSPFARHGYSNTIPYTHSSTLRTFQQVLGVTNYLGDAAAQVALDDLFGTPSGDVAAVTLTWAPSPGATGYKVTRGTASQGPFAIVATGISGTSYTDRGLVSGTTYFYSVVAVNGAGESPPAGPVSVRPLAVPAPPTSLVVRQNP